MDENFLQLKDTIQLHGKSLMGVGEMARPGEVSTAKTNDLSLIPGPSLWKKGTGSHRLASLFHMCSMAQMCVPIDKEEKRRGGTEERGGEEASSLFGKIGK